MIHSLNLTATYSNYTTITVTFEAYETAGYGRAAYYCDITDVTTDTVTIDKMCT